jgi:hypothetical protein
VSSQAPGEEQGESGGMTRQDGSSGQKNLIYVKKKVEGCQVRQSTLKGSTRETGSSYLCCTEVGT